MTGWTGKQLRAGRYTVVSPPGPAFTLAIGSSPVTGGSEDFVDVLAWITIGVGASCAAAGLVSLLAGRGHRGPERRGAHAAPRALAEPGARHAAWREFRTYLLIVATGAVWLVTQPKHRGAAEVLVAAAVVAIVAWQLGAWLTAPPGVGRGAALRGALL